ncbi:MAG: flagellar motor protein MotB, partial [Bacillota bacterium]|nr:flagellar motor protein MotB [Bacillota bacterium]
MKKKKGKEPNNERWLLTYSDLITLLMIFFVVMYATSNVDVNKYKLIAQSLNAAMGGGGANVIQVG